MKISEIFPSKYATGSDLAGRAVTLTIRRLVMEAMRPNPQSPEVEKWVIYFENAKRGVVMSKTLAKQIAEALGSDDTDNWLGKKITLYPENVVVAGTPRVAIRARAAQLVPANGNGNQ